MVSINIKYRYIIPRKLDAPHISIIMELATHLMPYSIISYESSLSDTLLDSVLRSYVDTRLTVKPKGAAPQA